MERRCSRETAFTATDKDEIAQNIEWLLRTNGYETEDSYDVVVVGLQRLCDVWMRIAIERSRRGIEGLARAERISSRRTLVTVSPDPFMGGKFS